MNVFVPYRATAWPQSRPTLMRASDPHVAYRPPRRGLGFLGAGGLVQTAGSVYSGATAGSLIGAGTSVAGAIGAGAAAGSFVPVIGTAIGAIVGLVVSGVFNHRVDPEVGNFNAAIQLYNSQGVNGIMNIADKYLVLAGLFDLEPKQIKGNIPIYKKYGRMGEERFVGDMCRLIYSAAQSGKITSNDTVQSVYNNIVAPWIASFGYGAMSDTNGEMITNILIGLIAEYITGLYKQRWFARGGTLPTTFAALTDFALPAASTQTLAPSPAQAQPVTPVANVPTAALPTNSTPGPPPPPIVFGTPQYMLSAGYQIIGVDPTYGNIYKTPGSNAPAVVVLNGQVVPYPAQIPSQSSQMPSVGTPVQTAPVQNAAPNVNFAPPVQYAGGGPVPYTPPAGSDTAAAPPQPQSAGVSPWLIGGFAVMLGLMMMAKPDGGGTATAKAR